MAHFAELDPNNIVLRVTVVSNADLLDENGVEQEALGVALCQKMLGGKWIQTSYNGNFRKKFALIGDTYNDSLDSFIEPQPFGSWSLDGNGDWQPPVPKPDGENQWNETTLSWEPITTE